MPALKAPFTYAGGKSMIAEQAWRIIGPVDHYREPFCGSAAMLLANPYPCTTEIINDLNGHVCNVWRAIACDPDGIAAHADWPVCEIDLFARHVQLVQRADQLAERLMADPDFYDTRLAAWWIWGASQWIGGDWATGRGKWSVQDGLIVAAADRGVRRQLPAISASEPNGTQRRSGVHAVGAAPGVRRKMPGIGADGSGNDGSAKGVHGVTRKMPAISPNGHGGDRRGGVAAGVKRRVPLIGADGSGNIAGNIGVHRQPGPDGSQDLYTWMNQLAARLRYVKRVCGDWQRILTDSTCWNYNGIKAIFLDPPYPGTDTTWYGSTNSDCWHAAQAWAIEQGQRPDSRIVLAGMDDQEMPPNWYRLQWKRNGGYGNAGAAKARAGGECLWFSPHCPGESKVAIEQFNRPIVAADTADYGPMFSQESD